MKTDIQIAQEAQLEHISKIGQKAGINDEYIEFYGNYKAKVDLEFFRKNKNEDGKLILVTAITPTAAGEGKTTTTVGLADVLKKTGRNCIAALYTRSGRERLLLDILSGELVGYIGIVCLCKHIAQSDRIRRRAGFFGGIFPCSVLNEEIWLENMVAERRISSCLMITRSSD